MKEYVNQKKELYSLLFNYIESIDEVEIDYQIFIIYLEKVEKCHKKERLIELFYLLLKVSDNYKRNSNFFEKIDHIFLYLDSHIKKNFSNYEVFNFFKSNKRILLNLFSKNIITMDKHILKYLLTKSDKNGQKYDQYFSPEINLFNNSKTMDDDFILEFNEKRKIGENDSLICTLIRNDSIDEFISYLNRNKISLSSKIERSIFETNNFLLKNEPTLIEYAAFYGSIQIIQYLNSNGIELTPSLWIYAMHSKSLKLIKILEDKKIEPSDKVFKKCLEEAIKCHHYKIARYIQDFLIDKENNIKNEKDVVYVALRYRNYSLFPKDFDVNDLILFYYACKYNYIRIADFIMKTNKYNYDMSIVNKQQISNIIFFFIKFHIKNFSNEISNIIFFFNKISHQNFF